MLAREQTDNEHGRTVCERCSTEVAERVMRQWFLRMTSYADRLLDGLDRLDWPERAKRLQRQWIGRSEGREVAFGDLVAFTTRPDTVPAVPFLAVTPGHPAAGSTRPHPMTGVPLPVVEAQYVIEAYGTGVVMGVPAHDQRDRRFAAVHGLPISDAPLLAAEEARRIGLPAVRYRLRDWLISRQRYWGPPIPIVHCDACGPVPVPEEQLPVELPEIADFRPTGTGESPLASSRAFVATTCPSCLEPARRETDVSDTFVDSSWYFLRYPSTEFHDRPWDIGRTRRWLPVDFYAGGHEHVQRHHLYARFVTMALHDLGLVPFEEPFPRIRLGGLIVKDGAKMSKSRGNVVVPDDYIDRHGSDVVRCALLFMSPWEQGGEFVVSAIDGVERFFTRVWRIVTGPDADEPCAADRFIAGVSDAIEKMHFNVAIARLMEFAPTARGKSSKDIFVRLLAPVAPHLAEELWHQLGHDGSVHETLWPEAEPAASPPPTVELVVQVDGKVKAVLTAPRGLGQEASTHLALQHERVKDALDGTRVTRVVFVPDRVVNLVTRR